MKALMILAILLTATALVMSWPLCFGWHPELVWPFFISLSGVAAIGIFFACAAQMRGG